LPWTSDLYGIAIDARRVRLSFELPQLAHAHKEIAPWSVRARRDGPEKPAKWFWESNDLGQRMTYGLPLDGQIEPPFRSFVKGEVSSCDVDDYSLNFAEGLQIHKREGEFVFRVCDPTSRWSTSSSAETGASNVKPWRFRPGLFEVWHRDRFRMADAIPLILRDAICSLRALRDCFRKRKDWERICELLEGVRDRDDSTLLQAVWA
jgi:hypothetical protein